MTYHPGQRVALVHTTNPDTRLRPGDRGTIRGYQADLHIVDVAWDNGCRLAIRLNAGDQIRIADDLTPPPDTSATSEEAGGRALAPRFVMLTHTPDMRVPHDRLRVTDLRRQPPPGGYTARLTLDGQPVAALTASTGRLRMSVFPGTQLDRDTWDAYVASCRLRGAPVSGRRVLEALVEEQDLTELTAAAWAGGGTVVRLIDHDRATIEAHEVMPRPATTADTEALNNQLTTQAVSGGGGAGWVIWTGTRWRWHTPPRPTGGRA